MEEKMEEEFDSRRRARAGSSELVLSVGEYAYTQDTTSGVIKVHTGPTVVNVTGQEFPVTYDPLKRLFSRVALEEARQLSPLAPQGHYCVLWNPAVDDKHPSERDKQVAPDLLVGQRVNIPGPCTFSLWPQQSAQVIGGHHLRSNQYLLVRVYDEEQARQNWTSAVIKPAAPTQAPGGDVSAQPAEPVVELAGEVPEDLSVGRLIVIRGDRVSFYIPPTGVEVVLDPDEEYVRNALTLERLEYAILVDEDGNKRYERGPRVVFPKPTEHFYEELDRAGRRIRAFKPIELNEIQGLHVKVIADYEEGGRRYKEGEELFITGKEVQIYFPRQEHSLISYDGKSKHFATAVPAGEARYVMNRKSGNVHQIKGPTMLLPDPRDEVIVRRVLSDRQCQDWYPGNQEALEYNRQLRELARQAPTTRRGVVSEGEVSRSREQRKAVPAQSTPLERSAVHQDAPAVLADEFTRGSTYTEPRTVTLDTKYAGVPSIDIWTGYAVMVVSKTGERRVEIGPKTILLEYDETLEALNMSTGTPKSTDELVRTVYLRVKNNQVSDLVYAETADHVTVSVWMSLRVNFESKPERWFEVENYVKTLTDHIRSIVKSHVRKVPIEDFYARSEDYVRDVIIGARNEDGSRPGRLFPENGMRITDVEVLQVQVGDERIAALLADAQRAAVESNIELGKAEKELRVAKRMEEIERERAEARAVTDQRKAELTAETIARDLGITLARVGAEVEEKSKRLEAQHAADAVSDAAVEAALGRARKELDQNLTFDRSRQELSRAGLEAETAAAVARFQAAQEGFSEAVLALSSQETLTKVAQALSVQSMLGGKSFVEVVDKIFVDTPLAKLLEKVERRAALPAKPPHGQK
jgi:major vault protein